MKLSVLVLLVFAVAACGDSLSVATEPTISFDGDSCSSSDPSDWDLKALEIQVANNADRRGAVIMGTYVDGSTREDLVAYGSDVSTRPDFINALEIFEVDPESTDTLLFDHGPGVYFMVCMPGPDTMVVLSDLTIP